MSGITRLALASRSPSLNQTPVELKFQIGVMGLAGLCLAAERQIGNPAGRRNWRPIMPSYYTPELIQTMRAALEEVMTRIPADHATPGIKARLAEIILKAAADGETSYEGLVAAASEQIQTILSMLI
jgi:hypothetical protein